MEAVQSLTKKKDNMEGKFKLTTTFWKIKALEWKVLWLMQRASLVQMLMCRRSEQQGAGFLVYRMITKPSWWKSRRPCTGCMLERRQRDQGQAESQIESMEQEVTMPFACVDAVSQGSPACQALVMKS